MSRMERVYDLLPDPEKQLVLKVKVISNSKDGIIFFQKILKRFLGEQNIRESTIKVYERESEPTTYVVFLDIVLRRVLLKLNSKYSIESLLSMNLNLSEDYSGDNKGGRNC